MLELDARYDWQVMYSVLKQDLKTSGHMWTFSVSNVYIFRVRAGREIPMASYVQYMYFDTTRKLQVIYTHVQHIEQLLYYRRHSQCGLVLHYRDPTGIRLETRIGHSLIQHCAHAASPNAHRYIWYATTPDNKTRLPYECILHTKRQL